jgi:cytochrome c oxidase subunit II
MGDLTPGNSTFSGPIDSLFMVVLVVTGLAFVLVEGVLVYTLVRFRHRDGRKALFTFGNRRLEFIWTVIPGIMLLWLAVYQYNTWAIAKIQQPAGDNVLHVDVSANQFEWNATYPGEDGILYTTDDIVAPINVMHFPVNRPVVVRLTSVDVIHSFFIPALRVKQDAIPGRYINVWFEATGPGEYELACAELCGLGHYRMKAQVIVESQAEFDAWLTDVVLRSQ